jgi:hypothetical protein
MALVAELVETAFEVSTVGYYTKQAIKFKNTVKMGREEKENGDYPKCRLCDCEFQPHYPITPSCNGIKFIKFSSASTNIAV